MNRQSGRTVYLVHADKYLPYYLGNNPQYMGMTEGQIRFARNRERASAYFRGLGSKFGAQRKRNFDPTITFKYHKNLFVSGAVKMDIFSTHTTHKGTSSFEIIKDLRTKEQLGVSIYSLAGTMNIGNDNTWSFGNQLVSIGKGPGQSTEINLSVPIPFANSAYGTTIDYNPQQMKKIVNWVQRKSPIIYYIMLYPAAEGAFVY